MLNILHVTYDMRIGGTEMVIKSLIEGCDTAQFCMSIFCLEAPLGPWGEELKASGIAVTSYERKQGFDTGAIKAIRKCIDEQRIDIVHCHQYTPWVYGTLASMLTKAKVIFTEHGRFYPDIKHPKRRFVNPLLILMTRKITAISQATANALAEYEYIPRNKIEIIYNGISENIPDGSNHIRNQLGISRSTLLLGNIARFDPIKNHLMMIESLKCLIEKGFNVHLLIVGDGECRAQIEHKIDQYDLGAHVTLTGYVSYPFDYLNSMDVFLLTSFSEGTSMTLLEAMRAGKPCIVTNVGGNPEVVEDNVTGRVIDSNDHAALTSVIAELTEDNIKMYGENARARFEKLFTSSTMCKDFSRNYNKLGLGT